MIADAITTTRISGFIKDTNETPLMGVPIELGSAASTTDATGHFLIEFSGPAPADTLFVRGEALTGSDTYPFIAEKLDLLFDHDLVDSVNNMLDRPIYLPALDTAQGDMIDPASDSMVDAVLQTGETAAEVFVSAGSLEDTSGNLFTGAVSITEVPRDLTPAALPGTAMPDVVVTIQPGEMVFNEPAELSLPNRAGYAPGTEMTLWSINPITGDFEDVGVGRVTTDGSMVETISGGVNNSNWHYFTPNPEDGEDNTKPPECDCESFGSAASDIGLETGVRIDSYNVASYMSQGVNRSVTLVHDSMRANPQPL